jgi:hypothetical protein
VPAWLQDAALGPGVRKYGCRWRRRPRVSRLRPQNKALQQLLRRKVGHTVHKLLDRRQSKVRRQNPVEQPHVAQPHPATGQVQRTRMPPTLSLNESGRCIHRHRRQNQLLEHSKLLLLFITQRSAAPPRHGAAGSASPLDSHPEPCQTPPALRPPNTRHHSS